MATTTFNPRELAAHPVAAPRQGTGFFRGIFDAIVESRMRAAERELRQHQDLIDRLKVRSAEIGKVTYETSGALPFNR